MTVVALSCESEDDAEYLAAVRGAGGEPRLLRFDVASLDKQLDGAGGVLLSGGGDVDPRRYGNASELVTDVDGERDEFELALVRRARELGLPTLCICRGLQVANVAFGGTLVPDIGSIYGERAGTVHRQMFDRKSVRGILIGHDVDIEPGSLLASIVQSSPLATGSRHHQCLASVAPELQVVARTADGIIEAAEARFVSPFWLGLQWHPESTLTLDSGASRAIFAAFIAAAEGSHVARSAGNPLSALDFSTDTSFSTGLRM